jgi:hypothetical protein
MAEEHNFARGDILRKVLERTGITAGRPLNLKRGAMDASHGAALLRKLRGLSQNAALLSAKLDDVIEFKVSDKEKKARWGAVAGGVPGTVSGGALGAYIGALHPKSMGPYLGSAMKSSTKEVMESIEGELGEGWKPEHWGVEKPFQKGHFTAGEAKARVRELNRRVSVKKALGRIGKYSAIGAATVGTAGALGGYAASKAGTHHGSNKLSAKLDGLIEFAEYPEAVMKTVWNRIKKPSRKTFGKIMRRHDPRSPIPTMVFREQAHMLSAKLDELLGFAADPRPRNLQGEFEPQGSGGPDPNAMARVYKMPQQQSASPSLSQGAGAALVGGALGAVGGNIGKSSWAASRKALKHLAARRKGVSTIIKP